MSHRNILAAGLVGLVAVLSVSCGNSRHIADPFVNFPDDKALAKVVRIVTAPSTTDTVFDLDGHECQTLQIARIFPTEYSDVYFSIRVFPLKGESPVNMGLARIISEDFAKVAGGDIHYDLHEMTARAVTEQIDYYGKVFNDTILPRLRESVVNGFYVNVDLRPVWVSDDSEVYTYSSYMESCSGGAPAVIDCYYVSYSRRLGREMTFDDLVAQPDRRKVRTELLEKLAAQQGKSVDEYLSWLTEYTSPGVSERLTVENFPIVHVAMYNGHLVFAYPQGVVAPVSQGCPLVFI